MKKAVFILPLLCMSCENPSKPSQDHQSDSLKPVDAELLGDGIIRGDKWTLAQLSDFFDKGLSVEEVEKAFGPTPFQSVDDDVLELLYEVDSDDFFRPGVRLAAISIVFESGELIDVSMQFRLIDEF
jgi:hypothetical protein